jgi:hypothetical protein
VDSLRAADQLARLEARIREFHRNLDTLEGAPASSGAAPPIDGAIPQTSAVPRAGDHADADDLVRRAAASARLAVSDGEATLRSGEPGGGIGAEPSRNGSSHRSTPGNGNGSPPPAMTNGDTGHRRRRSDRTSDAMVGQRRIDALRPEFRAPTDGRRLSGVVAPEPEPRPRPRPAAHAIAERIRREAESEADYLRQVAELEADQIRDVAELEMQELWQALESEVQAIQVEISRRVDILAARMEAVGREAEDMRVLAEEEAEQIHHAALAEADQVRALASRDAEELLGLAEREAHSLIAEARGQVEMLLERTQLRSPLREPASEQPGAAPTAAPSAPRTSDRNAADRIAEQIRDATAALTRRVSRTVEDPPPTRGREIRGPAIVPASVRELLDGLLSAVSLIERSLNGLADLLGDTLGAEPPEDR